MPCPTKALTSRPGPSSRSMLTKRGRRVATVASQRGCISRSSFVRSVNSCRGRSPVRRSRSRLPATGKSLVSTTHSNPASSARRMIASVIRRSENT